MALLQQLTPSLLYFLGLLIGFIKLNSWGAEAAAGWGTFAFITGISICFDFKTNKKGSLAMGALLLISALCINGDFGGRFWLWFAVVIMGVALVLVSTQSLTRNVVRLFVPVLIVSSLAAVSIVYALNLKEEILGAVAIAFFCLWSTVHLLFMNSRFREPVKAWWLIGLSQVLLALLILVVLSQIKAVQPLTDYILGAIVMIITLFTLVMPKKFGLIILLRIQYLMICIFAALRVDQLHWVSIWLLPFALALPVIATQSSKNNWPDVSVLELGGIGSGTFLVSIWILVQTQSSLEPWYFIMMALCLFFSSSRLWQELDWSQLFEESSASESQEKKWIIYFRWVMQVIAVIFVFAQIVGRDLGWAFI